MLKKLLAGLTAIALSLGMVALTAGPASAHSNNISATVACNTGPDGFWKVTWTVANDHGADATINTADRTTTPALAGTVIPANSSLQFVEYFTTQPSGNVTLNINSTWAGDNYNRDNSQTINKNKFDGDCVPDDTSKKITICHATASDSNPYTDPEVAVDSIITNDPNGHGTHADDIIPPFTYIKQGVPGSYPGQNWDAYGQWLYAHGCSTDVTPTKPVITEAVCTAEGQVGDAKYVIPSILGVYYETSSSSNGPWTTVAAGDHFVADGTSLWVRAVAESGYELAGNDENYTWKLDFTDVDASKCVTPAAPTPTYQECTRVGGLSQAKYTIPSDSGIQYQIWDGAQWVDIDAGDVNVNSFPTTIQIQAIAKPGFTLVGSPTSWTFEFASAVPCLIDATPVAPTFVDEVCAVDGPGVESGYYVVNGVVNDHLHYEVSTDSTNGVDGTWSPISDGPHDVATGVTVWIKAVPEAGYQLAGDVGPWHHTFNLPDTDCLDSSTVGDPIFVDEVCAVPGPGTVDGYYIVVAGSHVSYEISFDSTDGVDGTWNAVNPATYGNQIATSPGDHVWIRAIADSGYKLDPNAVNAWNHTFTAAQACGELDTEPPVDPVVTFVQTTCQVAGTYTLGVADIGNEAGVVWTVTGGLPTTIGKHSVSSAGPVTVTAQPAPGWGFNVPAPLVNGIPTLTWEFTFANLPDDCLPTLALTGGSIASGALGLSALLVLGGFLLVTVRRRGTVDMSV